MENPGTKDRFLMAITRAIEIIALSSTCKPGASIIVEVKEKTATPENIQVHQVKIITFATTCLGVLDMLVIDTEGHISKSVVEQQEALRQKDCLRIELTDPEHGIVTCETLRFGDSEKQPSVSSKRRALTHGDTPRYVAQFKCGFDRDDIRDICMRLHQYLYKLRAGSSPFQITLSVQSNQLPTKYLTTFCEEEQCLENVNPTPFLAESSHYFPDCQGDLLFHTSDACRLNIPAENTLQGLQDITLRCSVAVAHSGQQEANIQLYFYFGDNPRLPYSVSTNSSNIDAIPLIPWAEMDATLKNVAYGSEPNGLATPDASLTVLKKNTASPDLVLLFLTVSENSIVTRTTPKEIFSILNALRFQLSSIVSGNLATVRRTITEALKKALHHHSAEAARLRDCKNAEDAIILSAKSIRDVVASSSNTLFRETCFRMFDVSNSAALEQAVTSELKNIIRHGETASENRESEKDGIGAAGSSDNEDCERLLYYL